MKAKAKASKFIDENTILNDECMKNIFNRIKVLNFPLSYSKDQAIVSKLVSAKINEKKEIELTIKYE